MKRMNAIEHGIPKCKLAWVNVIASRCKCFFRRGALQRCAVKVTHNTVSALGLAQEVFSKREARIDGGDGSITVQTAIGWVNVSNVVGLVFLLLRGPPL